MSITIGVYDFFAYTIPGLLYLYILHESGKVLLKTPNVFALQIDPLALILLIAVAAYATGFFFDTLVGRPWHNLWCRFWYPGRSAEEALRKLAKHFSKLGIHFEPGDWEILFAVLRLRQPSLARSIDKFEADSVMFRNVSFGLFLLALFQLGLFSQNPQSVQPLIIAMLALIFSAVGIKGRMDFHLAFKSMIFQEASIYGRSLAEVLRNQEDAWEQGSPHAPADSKPTAGPGRSLRKNLHPRQRQVKVGN